VITLPLMSFVKTPLEGHGSSVNCTIRVPVLG